MFVAELGLPVGRTGVAGVAVFLEIVMSYDRGTSFVLSCQHMLKVLSTAYQ